METQTVEPVGTLIAALEPKGDEHYTTTGHNNAWLAKELKAGNATIVAGDDKPLSLLEMWAEVKAAFYVVDAEGRAIGSVEASLNLDGSYLEALDPDELRDPNGELPFERLGLAFEPIVRDTTPRIPTPPEEWRRKG